MSNITRVGKSAEEHAKDFTLAVLRGTERGVKRMEADAKLLVGVDTGRLRASLTSNTTLSGNTVVGMVGSNVEYAFFHSLQNPYLETAVDRNIQPLLKEVENEVNKL